MRPWSRFFWSLSHDVASLVGGPVQGLGNGTASAAPPTTKTARHLRAQLDHVGGGVSVWNCCNWRRCRDRRSRLCHCRGGGLHHSLGLRGGDHCFGCRRGCDLGLLSQQRGGLRQHIAATLAGERRGFTTPTQPDLAGGFSRLLTYSEAGTTTFLRWARTYKQRGRLVAAGASRRPITRCSATTDRFMSLKRLGYSAGSASSPAT